MYLIQRFEFRTKPSMNTKDSTIDDCTKRHHIEGIIKSLPVFNSYFSPTFIIKSKESIDTGNLMISSEQKYILRELKFVAKEKHDSFKRHWAAINIITEKQIIYVSGVARHFEYVNKILKLPVDVSWMKQKVPTIFKGDSSMRTMGC